MENDPAKENLGKELSACDLHQAAGALQSSCTDINHGSTAIKILSITFGLTDLYIDLFSAQYKKLCWLRDTTCVAEMSFQKYDVMHLWDIWKVVCAHFSHFCLLYQGSNDKKGIQKIFLILFLEFIIYPGANSASGLCVRWWHRHKWTCLLAFNSSVPAAPAKNKDYKETYKRRTVAI